MILCPLNLVGRVIGKQGSSINSIRDESRVSNIDIDRAGNDPTEITVTGSEAAVKEGENGRIIVTTFLLS